MKVPALGLWLLGLRLTYSLHCSSFLELPVRILNRKLVKPKKGTTMETIGRVGETTTLRSLASEARSS